MVFTSRENSLVFPLVFLVNFGFREMYLRILVLKLTHKLELKLSGRNLFCANID